MNILLTACRKRIKPAWFAAAVLCAAALAQSASSVWDGIYTAAQAQRGSATYADQCASCHGTDLTGGEMAPPLLGGEFQSNWNGLTVGDLFERIRTTMPANRPGTLNRDKNSDVLAYILSVNQFPAGQAELSRQTEALKQIQFLSSKPEGKK